jgi:hypothetical protein
MCVSISSSVRLCLAMRRHLPRERTPSACWARCAWQSAARAGTADGARASASCSPPPSLPFPFEPSRSPCAVALLFFCLAPRSRALCCGFAFCPLLERAINGLAPHNTQRHACELHATYVQQEGYRARAAGRPLVHPLSQAAQRNADESEQKGPFRGDSVAGGRGARQSDGPVE